MSRTRQAASPPATPLSDAVRPAEHADNSDLNGGYRSGAVRRLPRRNIETGDMSRQAFRDLADALGCNVVKVHGILTAHRPDGHIVAAAVAVAARGRAHQAAWPAIPCWTCGAMPTGPYFDGSPEYRCEPHEPTTDADRARKRVIAP